MKKQLSIKAAITALLCLFLANFYFMVTCPVEQTTIAVRVLSATLFMSGLLVAGWVMFMCVSTKFPKEKKQ